MRPLRVRLHNLTSLNDVDIDLRGIPRGSFVGIVGPNGAGKSTLMAALSGVAPLWRVLPDRKITKSSGPLRAHARGREAFVETTFEHAGSEWIARVSMDTECSGGIGKEEATLTRDGVVIAGHGCTEYDAAVAAHLPKRDVVLAAVYGAQTGTGAFHDMADDQRRALFAGMLGFEHHERKAKTAQAKRLATEAQARTVEATLSNARARALGADEAREEAKRLTYAVKAAKRAADATTSDLEAALAPPTVADIDQELTAALTLEHDAIGSYAQMTSALKRLEDEAVALAQTSDTLNRRLLSDDEIERIKRLIAAIDDRAARLTVASAEAALDEARRAEAACVQSEEEAKARLAGTRRRHEAAQRDAGRIASLREILQRREAELAAWVGPQLTNAEIAALRVRASGAGLQEAEGDLQRLSALAEQHDRNERDIKHAIGVNDQRAVAAADAATRLRGVPCKGERALMESTGEIVECGDCPLISQAVSARDAHGPLAVEAQELREKHVAAQMKAATTRGERDDVRAKVVALRGDLAAVEAELRLIDDKARRTAAVAEAREALEGACEIHDGDTQGVVEHHEAEAVQAARASQSARYRTQDAQGTLETVRHDAERRTLAQQRLQQHADTVQEWNRTETRRMEVYTETENLKRILLPAAEARRAETGAAVAEFTARRAQRQGVIDTARAAAQEAREVLHTAQAALSLAEANVARLNAAEEEARALQEELSQHNLLASRWGRLETSLGAKGLQAQLIAEAGPGVEAIVNRLLGEVFRGRWSVELVTQTGGERGKVLRDEISLRVMGSDGRWRDLSSFSGGEKVLISEAVKLGLALWSCRNNAAPGAGFGALYRDEADGALSVENAEAYPMMLRAALVEGGFWSVYGISHRASVLEQADAHIVVEGGTARLEM